MTSLIAIRPAFASVLLSVAFIAGCSSTGKTETGSGLITDTAARDADRIKAIRALPLTGPEAPADREMLRSIVWKRSENAEVRIAAIDALTAADPVEAGPMMSYLLPTETDWAVINHIGVLAVEHDWRQMSPALVRSWSRPADDPKDEDRPERIALTALHPDQDVVTIVFDVFVGEHGEGLFPDKIRADAWTLLMRLTADDSGELLSLLTKVEPTPDRPDVQALSRAATDLGVIPRTGEQLEMITLWFDGQHDAFVHVATGAIASLTVQQRTGLAVRHVAPVAWASQREPELLTQDHATLLQTLTARLHGRPRHDRDVGGSGPNFSVERLRDWDDRLVWADLLTIFVADAAMGDPAIGASMFAQAEKDRADTSTEHGGALVADWNVVDSADASLRAVSYLPRAALRTRDNEFVASTSLLRDAPDALFHYHFHAQRYRNRRFAGPSEGDILYADRYGRPCLVLTFTSAETLAVDYYQPGGARIDIGVIRRSAVGAAADGD